MCSSLRLGVLYCTVYRSERKVPTEQQCWQSATQEPQTKFSLERTVLTKPQASLKLDTCWHTFSQKQIFVPNSFRCFWHEIMFLEKRRYAFLGILLQHVHCPHHNLESSCQSVSAQKVVGETHVGPGATEAATHLGSLYLWNVFLYFIQERSLEEKCSTMIQKCLWYSWEECLVKLSRRQRRKLSLQCPWWQHYSQLLSLKNSGNFDNVS